MIKHLILTLIAAVAVGPLYGQTISEKKAGLSAGASDLSHDLQTHLVDVNNNLNASERQLNELYSEVWKLYKDNAPEEAYKDLTERIAQTKNERYNLQCNWRECATTSGVEEAYALWHQPDATIGQLVIDYGSDHYIYLLPHEISSIKLNVDSNLPVPRSSWNEMLELILTQNGVGIKQLNPYLRQLYFIKEDKSNLKLITSKRQDLEFLKPDERICFVITPEPIEICRTFAFLDKFINPNSTALQMIGRDIIVIAKVAEIQDLLKLFDFVSTNRGDKEFKVVSLRRVDVDEMAKILGAVFDHLGDDGSQLEQTAPKKGSKSKAAASSISTAGTGLRIIPLSHIAKAMFLIGTKEEIKKASEIIAQVENQVGDAEEKVIFWYTAKHSDPTELSEVLAKIYRLMVENRCQLREPGNKSPLGHLKGPVPLSQVPPGAVPIGPVPGAPPLAENFSRKDTLQPYLPRNAYDDGFYMNSRYVVDDSPVSIDRNKDNNRDRDNFIVDQKTGSIVMVLEADILPKMKDLLRKLDIPKKMVQIEVLLFEKKIDKQNNFGLNLLKIGL